MHLRDVEVTCRRLQFLVHTCSWVADLSIPASPIKVKTNITRPGFSESA